MLKGSIKENDELYCLIEVKVLLFQLQAVMVGLSKMVYRGDRTSWP